MQTKSDIIDSQDQSYLQRLHPFYFAYGNPLTKIQISFKTPLVTRWPLYLGYTQLMFWSLTKNSKPFRDQTFNPEVFYRQRVQQWGVFKSFDIGWAHNSNGKGGLDSRSYDQAYLRANMEKEYERWLVRLSLQTRFLYKLDKTNRDIRDYSGPLILRLSLIQLYQAYVDRSELSLEAISGGLFAERFDRGGYQISYSFRLGGLDMIPAFYVQFYTGFAESLLNYNQRVNTFRVGFIF